MGAAFKPVTAEAKQADRAMDAAGRSAQAMALKMALVEKAGYATGRSIRWAGGMMLGMAKWGALGALAGLGSLAVGVIKIGAKFEQFQAQLEGTEGSAEGAKKALDWVTKFAAKTPYELDQVTKAFVRARGVGIDPYTGAMTALGDAASGSNKTIMDAVEALADAQTGEFERLKEFNITSKSKGNDVTFSFVGKDGKNAFKTVKKDAISVQKAVIDIFNQKYAGGMIRQSKTLVGLWSNIKDTANGFLYRVAQGGIFDRLKNGAANLLENLNAMADDGTLERWANNISDSLEKMYDWASTFVQQTDWKKAGADIRDVAGAAWQLAKNIAWAVEQLRALSKLMGDLNAGQNRAQAWIGATFNGNPDQRASWQRRLDALNANERADAKRASPNYQSEQFRKVRGGRNAPVSVNRPRNAGPPQKIGGMVDIRVRTDPGVRTQTKVASSNRDVPLRMAKTGRVSTSA